MLSNNDLSSRFAITVIRIYASIRQAFHWRKDLDEFFIVSKGRRKIDETTCLLAKSLEHRKPADNTIQEGNILLYTFEVLM